MLYLICLLSLKELKQRYYRRYLKAAWAVLGLLALRPLLRREKSG